MLEFSRDKRATQGWGLVALFANLQWAGGKGMVECESPFHSIAAMNQELLFETQMPQGPVRY